METHNRTAVLQNLFDSWQRYSVSNLSETEKWLYIRSYRESSPKLKLSPQNWMCLRRRPLKQCEQVWYFVVSFNNYWSILVWSSFRLNDPHDFMNSTTLNQICFWLEIYLIEGSGKIMCSSTCPMCLDNLKRTTYCSLSYCFTISKFDLISIIVCSVQQSKFWHAEGYGILWRNN